MLLEVAFGAALIAAWRRAASRGKFTPERRAIYEGALQGCQGERGAEILRELATNFEKEGLKLPAKLMRKRADWITAPPEEWEKRRAAVKNCLQSDNIEMIERVAAAFEAETATGQARQLRRHIEAVRGGTWKKGTDVPLNAQQAVQHDVQTHPVTIPAPPMVEDVPEAIVMAAEPESKKKKKGKKEAAIHGE
jgi:transposase